MRGERQGGRQMGVWAATAVVTGEAISLGIFLTPPVWPNPLVRPRCWARSGAVWLSLRWPVHFCFTELAVRFPQAGGEYVYLRNGFGRRVAFLYGWMAAVVMYPGVGRGPQRGHSSICASSVSNALLAGQGSARAATFRSGSHELRWNAP